MRAVYVLNKANRPMTTKELSEISKVPREYLAKIVNTLSSKDIISTRKGRGGGISLNMRQTNLNLFDVIQAVDPFKHYTACPFDIDIHHDRPCCLHHRLEIFVRDAEAQLKSTYFNDLIESSESETGLCKSHDHQPIVLQKNTRGRAPLINRIL